MWTAEGELVGASLELQLWKGGAFERTIASGVPVDETSSTLPP